MKVILSKMLVEFDMDVENNFRAAVDDTRRWAAIIGHDFVLSSTKNWLKIRSGFPLDRKSHHSLCLVE